jgi:CheY-like chemotaxis protein
VERDGLVLLDVGLPGEDGFALARWLREKRAHRHHHGHCRLEHRQPRLYLSATPIIKLFPRISQAALKVGDSPLRHDE